MAQKRRISPNRGAGRQPLDWLIWGGSLTTLFFWASLNDPFNAPKSWIISIVGFWLLGWIAFQVKSQIAIRPLKWFTILAGAYLLAISLAYIATDNSYIGFFGDYQRRSGYLSYLALISFLVAAAYICNIERLVTLQTASLAVGLILGLYGFLQHFKHDFIHWNNPFNPVIATLGNPDFAGAIMAIFLVLNFGLLFQGKKSLWIKTLASLNSILLIIVIVFSQVRQALLASALGIGFILIIWVNQRRKKIARSFTAIAFLSGIFGIAGMLDKGPLTKYFYKISVTYRGDYWRAGWRMFIHHPIFGVGLDRYGAYFRQYRDAAQSLRRGPDLVSNNAHNVPLQLAATGGVFVFLTFLILTLFIAWRGITALRRNSGAQQMLIAVIFGAWIAYEAQSLISIDNLAIAVWGYILGGVLVGLSIPLEESKLITVNTSNIQPFISFLLVLLPLVTSLLFLKGELAMNAVNRVQAPTSQADMASFKQFLQKPLSYVFKEPQFQLLVARREIQAQDFASATPVLQSIASADSRNFKAQDTLSLIYEFDKNWKSALPIRQHLAKIDPFNQENLLLLGQDEKAIGNVAAAKEVITRINAFAPNSAEAKQAIKDFGK